MINSGRENEVKWGNALGFIILPFHIGTHKDPLDYVRKAKKVVDRKKSSLEVVFAHAAAEVILKLFGLKVHMSSLLYHCLIYHFDRYNNSAGKAITTNIPSSFYIVIVSSFI